MVLYKHKWLRGEYLSIHVKVNLACFVLFHTLEIILAFSTFCSLNYQMCSDTHLMSHSESPQKFSTSGNSSSTCVLGGLQRGTCIHVARSEMRQLCAVACVTCGLV